MTEKKAEKNFDPVDLIDGTKIRGETISVSYDEIIAITAKASLLSIGGSQVWVPKSMVIDADDKEIWVSEWFAKEHDLA